ncbi:MAG: hypothetical protein JSU04_05170 [Bdellovibrionales bacterium]|nr:hypothetical protein [Bdellovibrionales bacterium]
MRAFLILATFLMTTSSAFAVKIVGNGGDTYAIEFVSVASDILDYLQYTADGKVDLAKLKEVVKATKVESTNQLLSLKGMPKDAINYPAEKRILFSRTAWGNAKEAEKPRLVLHEYLGVFGADDSSYALSTDLLRGFGYGKNVMEVEGPYTVNFATDKEYLLDAHVTIENYGPMSWHYNADEERIRLVVEYKGQRKIFLLPAKGHVMSAASDNGGEDNGIYVSILQPLKDKNGRKKKITEDGSEYYEHVIRDYRIEFQSKKKDSMPDDADFSGPISNTAG